MMESRRGVGGRSARRPVRGLFTAGLLASVAACGGPAPAAHLAPAMCGPTMATLAPGATLEEMSGSFTLTMVGAEGRTTGSLTLAEQPDGMRTMRDAATPLGGPVEIDLGAVGAQEVRTLDSTDPAAPGALVLESDGSEGRTILVRLGSEANRRDVQAFDGAYAVLSVRSIEDGGFSGAWWSGVRDVRNEGYFCAMLEADG